MKIGIEKIHPHHDSSNYKDMKKRLMEKRSSKSIPRFQLKFPAGQNAQLDIQHELRTPLMLEDVQYLLMTSLLGSSSPFKPERWCVLEKVNKITQTVVLVIEGLTSYAFMSNESHFKKTKEIFQSQLEVAFPKYEKNQIIEELSSVPLTQSLKDTLIRTYGSLEAAVNMNRDHHLVAKTGFSISSEVKLDVDLFDGESFSRTLLLLSPLQMMIENYPLPLKGEFEDRYRGFRCTKQTYEPVTHRSPMFGLDCEMCRTSYAQNELTRVSIVDENFQSVYESLVRPPNEIVDYLTPWSGITKEMMAHVTKTLEEVQREVCELLPSDAILVGQSLNCDLNAMKLMHPYVIDTSCIYNMTGDRNKKSKLQYLTKNFLGEDIQMCGEGHSSIEDSIASLKLTKLKLSKDIYFGDIVMQTAKTANERKFKSGISEGVGEQKVTSSMISHAVKSAKKSAIITTSTSDLDLKKIYSKNHAQERDDQNDVKHFRASSAKDVVKKAQETIWDHDFNMLHFNILEDPVYCTDEDDDGIATDEKLTGIIPKIDKWINRVWKSVSAKGLFVVLFGGNEKNNHGLSMIRIKPDRI